MGRLAGRLLVEAEVLAELVADLRAMDAMGAIELDRWPAAKRLVELWDEA